MNTEFIDAFSIDLNVDAISATVPVDTQLSVPQ